jgi:hypothetical protein
MALCCRWKARLVKSKAVGDVPDGLGANPVDLSEVPGAAKRLMLPRSLTESLAKCDYCLRPHPPHAGQPQETNERGGVRIKRSSQARRRIARSGRDRRRAAKRHSDPHAATYREAQTLRPGLGKTLTD